MGGKHSLARVVNERNNCKLEDITSSCIDVREIQIVWMLRIVKFIVKFIGLKEEHFNVETRKDIKTLNLQKSLPRQTVLAEI